ncbi:ABC transporter permease subunit [Streptomyces daliensis]|uniref:ABC transporter permease subunit n=1 Tax=Streptomyces daliensis TaxID=299421 RepID=A0A8T4IWB1_9ACTN|nr:ABC transporter permease subunit [Streptomyces daliensis]
MWVAAGRLAAAVLVLLAVGLLPWLTRTDPARAILHARYADREPTPSALAAIRAQTGLDEGPARVLGRWLGGLVRGDFGTSWVSGLPVRPDVLSGLGVSLTLMGVSLAVAVLLAAALSLRTLLAGARGTGAVRARAGTLAAVLAALPEFLLAAVFAAVFAVRLGWFPPLGWDGPQTAVLPALAMGVPAGALLGRLLDDALPAAFAEPWVRTNVAFGVPPARIARHALRRVLPPLLPQFGFVVVGLTGGAVAVESLFAVPGLGRTALDAALAQDLPVLQASVLVLLALGVAVGALVGVARRTLIGPALHAAAIPALRRPRLPAGPLLWGATGVLGALLAVTVVVGLLRDPLAVDAAARLASPSAAHPLGTDSLGRDVLARLGHGAARTALTAVAVGAVTLLAGLAAGLLARWTEGLREVANALPPVVSGLIVAGLLGPGAWGAAVAVAVVAWAPLAAHTAGLYEEERAAAHLESAVALGAGRAHLLTRHVLPGVLPPVLRHALLRVPALALALASLGFLGLGAEPPAPEWGRMLSENMPYVERAPWAVLAPAAALAALGALSVLAGSLRLPRRRGGGGAVRADGAVASADGRPLAEGAVR